MSTNRDPENRRALGEAAKAAALHGLPTPVEQTTVVPVETSSTTTISPTSAALHDSPTTRYPFVDSGKVSDVLLAAPKPSFLNAAQPIKYKLAAQVFTDLSAGRRGIRVQDIPDALSALGLHLDTELVPAFHGKNQDMILSMERWQTVLKRFVAREEAKHEVFLQDSAKPLREENKVGVSESKDQAGCFREIQSDSHIDSRTRIQRRQDFATVFARYQRKERLGHQQEESANSIADMFLRGPIGQELFSKPRVWSEYDDKDDIQGYNPNLRPTFPDAESDDESLDAQDERLFLKALGLKVPKKAAYKESMALKDAVDLQSHPALQPTLMGVKNKLSKSDKVVQQRLAARQAERDASVAEGWIRSKGGWAADFGPPSKSKQGLTSLQNKENRDDEQNAAEVAAIGALSSTTIDMLTNRIKLATTADALAALTDGFDTNKDTDQSLSSPDSKKKTRKSRAGKSSISVASNSSIASSFGDLANSKSSSPDQASASSSSSSSESGSPITSQTTASRTSTTAETNRKDLNAGTTKVSEISPMSQKVNRLVAGADKVTVNVQHSWNKR